MIVPIAAKIKKQTLQNACSPKNYMKTLSGVSSIFLKLILGKENKLRNFLINKTEYK